MFSDSEQETPLAVQSLKQAIGLMFIFNIRSALTHMNSLKFKKRSINHSNALLFTKQRIFRIKFRYLV